MRDMQEQETKVLEKRRLTEKEIKERFNDALKSGAVYACYQAQVNHLTNQLIGAEALMRWDDPEFGPQLPSDFIPVLEKEGLIFAADIFVFGEVCRFLLKCLKNGIMPVPISVNMSRFDIETNNDYVQGIEALRTLYGIPVRYLRIEITETFASHGKDAIVDVLEELHSLGYVVEMDDFGSGYSSLNILKDLEVDIIKLDMGFLKNGSGTRGGAIINSVMQMSKWLDTPVIAEGVETREQADYMSSIGCCYIQGYLYAKPVKEDEFLLNVMNSEHDLNLISTLYEDIDTGRFWDPASIETLLFNNFIGPAVIFTYEYGKTERIRVNRKYIKELGADINEKIILSSDPWEGFNEENRKVYERTIKKAIETGLEEECETWRATCSDLCGDDRIWIRSSMRVIGRAGDQALLFASIRNITAEKLLYENEKRFRMASEQIH